MEAECLRLATRNQNVITLFSRLNEEIIMIILNHGTAGTTQAVM